MRVTISGMPNMASIVRGCAWDGWLTGRNGDGDTDEEMPPSLVVIVSALPSAVGHLVTLFGLVRRGFLVDHTPLDKDRVQVPGCTQGGYGKCFKSRLSQ